MKNTNQVSAILVKTRVELLMNYFEVVVRWQDEHLKLAMTEYSQSLATERVGAGERTYGVAA